MSYRIDVITDSVPEAIRHAGGLIFDRRRAGWEVVVVTNDAVHSRAAAILGARIASPGNAESRLQEAQRENRTVLAAIGDATSSRELLGPRGGLLLWGRQAEDEDDSTGILRPVRHDLSPAAQIFKAQALLATGLTASVEHCEQFWARSDSRTGSQIPTVVGR